jgi:hypothetical protein
VKQVPQVPQAAIPWYTPVMADMSSGMRRCCFCRHEIAPCEKASWCAVCGDRVHLRCGRTWTCGWCYQELCHSCYTNHTCERSTGTPAPHRAAATLAAVAQGSSDTLAAVDGHPGAAQGSSGDQVPQVHQAPQVAAQHLCSVHGTDLEFFSTVPRFPAPPAFYARYYVILECTEKPSICGIWYCPWLHMRNHLPFSLGPDSRILPGMHMQSYNDLESAQECWKQKTGLDVFLRGA